MLKKITLTTETMTRVLALLSSTDEESRDLGVVMCEQLTASQYYELSKQYEFRFLVNGRTQHKVRKIFMTSRGRLKFKHK